MVERAENVEGLKYIYPQGAFYLMLDIRSFIGKSYKGEVIDSSLAFADRLLTDYNVALIPGSGFGLEGFVRLSYAINIDSIKKGFDRLEEFLSQLS